MRSACEVGLNLNHHIGLHLFFSNWIVCVCRVRRRHNPEEGPHPCILVYLFFVYLKSSNICISSLSLSIPNSRYIEEICFNMFFSPCSHFWIRWKYTSQFGALQNLSIGVCFILFLYPMDPKFAPSYIWMGTFSPYLCVTIVSCNFWNGPGCTRVPGHWSWRESVGSMLLESILFFS